MLTRIKEIIDSENLSPSRFADYIGVPRSTISHIMSGRNKASLEVVQKILESFPHISADWLVLGKGGNAKKQPDLFSEITERRDSEMPFHENMSTAKPDKTTPVQQKIKVNDEDEEKNEIGNKTISQTEKIEDQGVDTGKKTIKIIELYSDGSYTEYFPGK